MTVSTILENLCRAESYQAANQIITESENSDGGNQLILANHFASWIENHKSANEDIYLLLSAINNVRKLEQESNMDSVYRVFLRIFQNKTKLSFENDFNNLLALIPLEQQSEMLPDFLEFDSHEVSEKEIVKILADIPLEERVSVLKVTASLLKGTTIDSEAIGILETVSKIKAEERVPLLMEGLLSMKSLKDLDSDCWGMVQFLEMVVAHPQKEIVAIIEELIPLLTGVVDYFEREEIFETFSLIPLDHLSMCAPIFLEWIKEEDEGALSDTIRDIDEKERVSVIELVNSLNITNKGWSHKRTITFLAPLSKKQRNFVIENQNSILGSCIGNYVLWSILEIIDLIPEAEKVVALEILSEIGYRGNGVFGSLDGVLSKIDKIPPEKIATALLYAHYVNGGPPPGDAIYKFGELFESLAKVSLEEMKREILSVTITKKIIELKLLELAINGLAIPSAEDLRETLIEALFPYFYEIAFTMQYGFAEWSLLIKLADIPSTEHKHTILSWFIWDQLEIVPNKVVAKSGSDKAITLPDLSTIPLDPLLSYFDAIDFKDKQFANKGYAQRQLRNSLAALLQKIKKREIYVAVPKEERDRNIWYQNLHNTLAAALQVVEEREKSGTLDRSNLQGELINLAKAGNYCGTAWRNSASTLYRVIAGLIEAPESCGFENQVLIWLDRYKEGVINNLLEIFKSRVGLGSLPHLYNHIVKTLLQTGVQFSENTLSSYDPNDPLTTLERTVKKERIITIFNENFTTSKIFYYLVYEVLRMQSQELIYEELKTLAEQQHVEQILQIEQHLDSLKLEEGRLLLNEKKEEAERKIAILEEKEVPNTLPNRILKQKIKAALPDYLPVEEGKADLLASEREELARLSALSEDEIKNLGAAGAAEKIQRQKNELLVSFLVKKGFLNNSKPTLEGVVELLVQKGFFKRGLGKWM